MNILYVALKESLPGTHGGAVHVLEVMRGLAARGHAVRVVLRAQAGQAGDEVIEGAHLHRLRAPSPFLLWTLAGEVQRIAQRVRPDVVMERYYNFSGAGLWAARALQIPSLLEVNAPMMDPAGTPKARVDALAGHMFSRYARWQAENAGRIVTPSAVTVSREIARDKVREIPWGANVHLFDRARLDPVQQEALRARLGLDGCKLIVFSGSFRGWHGVRELAEVALELTEARPDVAFLLVGSGELWKEIHRRVEGHPRIVLTGAVPYGQVPEYLGLGDIGVAPFNTAYLPALRAGFYWSPLKVHEYMAMSLPVVTINVPGLDALARADREGLLYPDGDTKGLRVALEVLLDDPARARRLGAAGRTRVVEEFSWEKHAERLERVLKELVSTDRNG